MSINYSETPLETIYGEYCFSEAVMKQRLPKSVFKEFKRVQTGESELSLDIAEVIASAMKDWAIEKGATHYTHWFQPLTGLTAEKHDSFIAPEQDGTVLMEFSGKELIQGEPDASSFPNGGLRDTFEARGYTAWDTGSPAFLKQDNTGLTLTIPTAFVSYTSEALDKKTPLLRSMDAIGKQTMRILRLMGNTASKRVITSVGAEQEYFLIDKEYFLGRPDLKLTGRTVFGTMSAKGQELDDHYFGAIKDRVADFMRELNTELWKLGISAKTQHNEVAPNQFELAPIFSSSNVATDTNQITMEMMKKVADRHDLACLLHEKPFAGVNGSGKHNNWSLATDDGINLLNPGATPQDNAQFLLFCVATIKAVDKYADVLRASAASPGNDHRLGANEAPPAVISIFLGDQLSDILEKLAAGEAIADEGGKKMIIGASSLPDIPMDMTDRNRTSPFAFTGNKFEFRMVGSAQSIAGSNVVLNTAVAEVLDEFATRMEKAEDVNDEIRTIVRETYRAHSRIVFNGNGYSDEWLAEAEKRGLPNLSSTVEAVPVMNSEKCVALFSKYKVLSKKELDSRVDIYLENYSKQVNIEAGVAYEMAGRLIFPVVSEYAASVAATIASVKGVLPSANTSAQEALLERLNELMECLLEKNEALQKEIEGALALEEDLHAQALAYSEKVIPAMNALRACADALEKITDKESWPYPSYEDMLFNL